MSKMKSPEADSVMIFCLLPGFLFSGCRILKAKIVRTMTGLGKFEHNPIVIICLAADYRHAVVAV